MRRGLLNENINLTIKFKFTEHVRGGTFESAGVASEIIVIRKAA